jgi:hypothetical protein
VLPEPLLCHLYYHPNTHLVVYYIHGRIPIDLGDTIQKGLPTGVARNYTTSSKYCRALALWKASNDSIALLTTIERELIVLYINAKYLVFDGMVDFKNKKNLKSELVILETQKVTWNRAENQRVWPKLSPFLLLYILHFIFGQYSIDSFLVVYTCRSRYLTPRKSS